MLAPKIGTASVCWGRLPNECSLRPSVLGQDWSETKKPVLVGLDLAHCGLGLAVLVLFCETRSCNARHNDLEGSTQQLFKS